MTVMVLDLRVHRPVTLGALLELLPTLGSYLISFVFLAVCWINHHSILSRVRAVDRVTLWMNMQWLFWISLFPFATSCVSETRGAAWAVALYAALQACMALAYRSVVYRVTARPSSIGFDATLWRSESRRNLVAILLYLVAAGIAWYLAAAGLILIVLSVLSYFMPNRHSGQKTLTAAAG